MWQVQNDVVIVVAVGTFVYQHTPNEWIDRGSVEEKLKKGQKFVDSLGGKYEWKRQSSEYG